MFIVALWCEKLSLLLGVKSFTAHDNLNMTVIRLLL